MTLPSFTQKTSRLPLRIFARIFFGVRVSGLQNIKNLYNPHNQFIIVANHCGRIDPWLVGYFMPRNIYYHSKALRFMAYKSYMDMFLLGPFLRMWGAYPIMNKTGKPLNEVLEETIRILKNGNSLMIFPEGKIAKKGELPSAKPGVAYLAKESGLPIMPVLIKRHRRKFFFSKYNLIFGAPFYYNDIADSDSDLRIAAEKIMERVRNMDGVSGVK